MAFIPDEAIDNAYSVQPTSFRLYAYICRRRYHATGKALLTIDHLTAALNLSRAQIYRALAELTTRKWIQRQDNLITPTYGSFAPVRGGRNLAQTPLGPRPPAETPESHICDGESQICDSALKDTQRILTSADNTETSSTTLPRARAVQHWTDRIKAKHPELHPAHVELAVIYTLQRTTRDPDSIHSENYFMPEITTMTRELPQLGPMALTALLQRRRQQLTQ